MPTLRASVVIPTKNRRDILRDTVASILQQDEPLEIIVLDDGSKDGTSEMLRAEFPGVRVESFRRSRGPAYRRNQGARIARGEFLFTIDDDCILPHADTFARTIAEFDDARIGAVTIPFINVHKDADLTLTAAPNADQTYVAYEYYGGMVAFRRDLFNELGGYRSYYFMNIEEGDYAVRMLENGYVVKLGTAPPIDHHESPIRASKRLNELGPRNHILYAWYNVPMPHMPLHLLGTGAKSALYIAKLGHPDQAIRGYIKGWLAILHELGRREPVSPTCYKLSRELKARAIVPLAEIEARLNAIVAENADGANAGELSSQVEVSASGESSEITNKSGADADGLSGESEASASGERGEIVNESGANAGELSGESEASASGATINESGSADADAIAGELAGEAGE